MKKRQTLILALAILAQALCIPAFAQRNDKILEQIEETNAKVSTRQDDFVETRKPAGKAEATFDGQLLYDASKGLTMNYSDEDEYFAIEGNTMSIKHDGKSMTFDLNKNKPMRTLSKFILSAFNGKLRELAQEANSEISVAETENAIEVTLVAKKKAVKGYSKVVLNYDPKAFTLIDMLMEEFDGSVTTYKWK